MIYILFLLYIFKNPHLPNPWGIGKGNGKCLKPIEPIVSLRDFDCKKKKECILSCSVKNRDYDVLKPVVDKILSGSKCFPKVVNRFDTLTKMIKTWFLAEDRNFWMIIMLRGKVYEKYSMHIVFINKRSLCGEIAYDSLYNLYRLEFK